MELSYFYIELMKYKEENESISAFAKRLKLRRIQLYDWKEGVLPKPESLRKIFDNLQLDPYQRARLETTASGTPPSETILPLHGHSAANLAERLIERLEEAHKLFKHDTVSESDYYSETIRGLRAVFQKSRDRYALIHDVSAPEFNASDLRWSIRAVLEVLESPEYQEIPNSEWHWLYEALKRIIKDCAYFESEFDRIIHPELEDIDLTPPDEALVRESTPLMEAAPRIDLALPSMVPPCALTPSEFVQIPLYSARLAAGTGEIPEEGRESSIAFRRDWIQSISSDWTGLVALRVSGDSMEPVLFDGDLVLVDQSTRPFISGAIYGFREDLEVFIKYLSTIPEDADYILVVSENKRYKARKVRRDDINDLRLLVWSAHEYKWEP